MRLLTLAFAAALTLVSLEWLPAAHARVPLGLGGSTQEVPTLAPLLKNITPAVVSVAIRGRVQQQRGSALIDPFLRELFGMPEMPAERQIYAAGSGVVFDAAQGYVVTDAHVVENADEILVILTDGRRLKASLVGADPETDVAIVKIAAESLTAIPFGDSDRLEVGDFVVAIGNPFSIGQTVTSGIVSAVRRHGLGLQGYEDFIQTDASINPGNSGGALINLRGELVGINAAIVGTSGGSSGNIGIGFAIPINMVRNVADQLLKYGSASHGQLGITVEELAPDVVQRIAAFAQSGVTITKMETGSSGERAGLTMGDIVVSINSVPVRDSSDLRNKVGMSRVGDVVELAVLRNGKPLTVQATLTAPIRKTLQGEQLSRLFDGAVFGTPGTGVSGKGVEVVSVRDGSTAAKAGLKKGDLIRLVNDQRVTGPDEFATQVKASPNELTLNILRDGVSMTLFITDRRR